MLKNVQGLMGVVVKGIASENVVSFASHFCQRTVLRGQSYLL